MAIQNSHSNRLVDVRSASSADIEIVHELIGEYATGHPAEHHPRPAQAISAAYFGSIPLAHILIAEICGQPVGFAAWRKVFDMLWALYGGEMDAVYVKHANRGRGIAVNLIAAVCAHIRREGGEFLRATYTHDVGKLYERLAIANPQSECHLSATAFQQVADLDGCGVRELLRRLPAKKLNYVRR